MSNFDKNKLNEIQYILERRRRGTNISIGDSTLQRKPNGRMALLYRNQPEAHLPLHPGPLKYASIK